MYSKKVLKHTYLDMVTLNPGWKAPLCTFNWFPVAVWGAAVFLAFVNLLTDFIGEAVWPREFEEFVRLSKKDPLFVLGYLLACNSGLLPILFGLLLFNGYVLHRFWLLASVFELLTECEIFWPSVGLPLALETGVWLGSLVNLNFETGLSWSMTGLPPNPEIVDSLYKDVPTAS